MKQLYLISTICIIFCIGIFFRLYHLNWDQHSHLHPDERAIVLVTTNLTYPQSVKQFLQISSPWNPHFFAYGSFPLYLLKISADVLHYFDARFTTYDMITILGRCISTIFDIGTLLLLFYLAKRFFSLSIARLATFFYAVSVLPIQLSHFYAVDTVLTFFIMATLLATLLFYEKPTLKSALLIGIFFGLALATKISAFVLISTIALTLLGNFNHIFLKHPHKWQLWIPHSKNILKRFVGYGSLITLTTILVFIICEPYAVISFKEFWLQTLQQSAMTKDAFVFPYTLQYVGKVPYIYEIKNIFFWGQGIILATLCISGTFFVTIKTVRKNTINTPYTIILLIFFWIYFAVVGNFHVGFMRYLLPLYPLLCLFGALFLITTTQKLPQTKRNYFFILILIIVPIWAISFLHIYSAPTTRVLASEWIRTNIPTGKTLAVEHWDDQLPLRIADKYLTNTLPLYDPDTPAKWQAISAMLSKSDYLIIASNRLYTPLQKLTDCNKLFPHPCYRETAKYYQKLFTGKLGFQKVAEFAIYPQIPVIKKDIIDETADESFTVYDHPKIMIFQKL